MATVIGMPVVQANLKIHKGETFNPILYVCSQQTGLPIDYSAYTGTLQIWADINAVTSIAEYNTSNGGLILGNGTIQINITASQTTAISYTSAYYTLRLTAPDTTVDLFAEGSVIINQK